MHKEFVPLGQTVNQKFYLKVLKRLHDSVQKKDQKCGAAGECFLHHDNAPAHTTLMCSIVWRKQHDCYPSLSLFTRPCDMRHFSVSSYERPDERETFY